MAYRVDARGLSCPQPVVMTKKALDSCGDVQVLVDNATAMENVSRFARHSGCDVDVEASPEAGEGGEGCDCYIIRIHAKGRA